jgi:hypothetical protein
MKRLSAVSHVRSTVRAAPCANYSLDGSTRLTITSANISGQQKQVSELIDDLTTKFSESHEDGNERSAVADYGHYFLGSIIVSDKDGQKFIIDGQQRLTTLTLLLRCRREGADR